MNQDFNTNTKNNDKSVRKDSVSGKVKDSSILFFTNTGFGIKSISKETIKKNFRVLKDIAADAQKNLDKKTQKQAEQTS